MGTKNDPGEFDCYGKADDAEPLFTLLARDHHAPALVRMWAAVREGDVFEAVEQFNELVKGRQWGVDGWGPSPKTVEAQACADAMEAYRAEFIDKE